METVTFFYILENVHFFPVVFWGHLQRYWDTTQILPNREPLKGKERVGVNWTVQSWSHIVPSSSSGEYSFPTTNGWTFLILGNSMVAPSSLWKKEAKCRRCFILWDISRLYFLNSYFDDREVTGRGKSIHQDWQTRWLRTIEGDQKERNEVFFQAFAFPPSPCFNSS